MSCTPVSGTSFAPGSVVNCLFTAGPAFVLGSLVWTASNFTPASSTANPGQAFTAGATGGAASITATWNDGAPRTQTFVYTITSSATLVCNPVGGALNAGQAVICGFTGTAGSTFTGWASTGFTPNLSAATTQVFVAGAPSLTASITGTWTDSSGGHSAVFLYSIVGAPVPPIPPIGVKTSITASSALGKTKDPTRFTVGTKVASIVPGTNNVVTIRFKMSPSTAGKIIQIYKASRACVSGTPPGQVVCTPGHHYNGWSGFTLFTARAVDADGFAYMYVSTKTAQWLSFYGSFPGDTVQGPGRSQTQQVRWK